MNVRNCRKCGRIFNYVAGPHICPACREKQEEKFQEVKNFIRDNKDASINVVSEECDVEIPQIQQWIREERLAFSDDSPIGVSCENCGAMIKTGRFCEKCKKGMATDLSNAIRKPEAPRLEPKKQDRENPKMRFLDR
ncbi:MAG: flagellar protein [Lachnospiraceae bacterium]|nr:flagellar protein [Lachnospiraceae bacterium]MBD5483153.1 flagellar protein [Lachnospiraceae bacterium]